MDEEEAFDLVDESRSSEFPDGNVKVALENLEREYTEEPDKEKERYQEQLDEGEKLKVNEDPTKILTRLHIIQKVLEKRFKVKVTDREIWRKLLRRLPEQYSVEKTVLTIKLDAGELTKKILDSTLGRKYDDIKKGKLSEEVESTENEGAFVGKETRNVPRERKACSLCGKLGHVRDNCWQDPKNAKAREDYLRRMGERSEMGDRKNGFAPFGGRAYLDTHYFRTPHRETRTCYRCGSRGHIARNCPLGNEIHLEEGNVGID